MYKFQPMKTSTLIICQMILENILDEVYEVLVTIPLKQHSNSCCKNIHLSDDVWVIIFNQFEVLYQTFTFYKLVANMVNVVLRPHKLLAISLKVIFCNSLWISPPWRLFIFLLFIFNWFYLYTIYLYIYRTNPRIQISINLIVSNWITDIYREFFGKYINQVKYRLIIDLDRFKASLV